MQNYELEELADAYQNDAERFIPEYERERMRFLDEEALPAPLFQRTVGGLLVRLGTRLDPDSVIELRSDLDPLLDDPVAESQLSGIR